MAQLTERAQTIPTDLADEKGRGINLKFVIGGLVLVIIVAALMVQATMTTGAYYMTVDEIRDNFALLDDWDDRYRYVIELGRALPPMPDSAHTDANKVQREDLKRMMMN